MSSELVEILLATYNGEEYLESQIDSILDQDYENILISARDDGSSDNTRSILSKYSAKHPSKIRTYFNENDPEGPVTNFSELLSLSTAEYIMLSDQDDYWMKNKITRLMELLKSQEKVHGVDKPLLAHSDLIVADKNLDLVHRSFWRYSGHDPRKDSFGRLLVQNVITGSASILNRPLAKLCIPIPKNVTMHDWWMALVASALGEIGFLNESTMFYRQHESNVLGAKQFSWRLSFLLSKARNVFFPDPSDILLEKNYEQARVFKQAYYPKLTKEKKMQLDAFVGLRSQNIVTRRYHMLRYGFLLNKFIQNIGLFIRI